MRPDKLARVAERYIRWGASPALGSAANAITHPDHTAIIDEAGALTWEETHRRSNALARALRDEGIEMGDGVAIMCRNHRYFIEATMACAKLGAIALYLNTAFAGPQLVDVMEREDPKAMIYDQEFGELLSEVKGGLRRYVAWEDEVDKADETTVEELISGAERDDDLKAPPEHGRYIILTSGTTGTPKGAQRSQPEGLSPLAALLSKIPRRSGETVMIGAPLFHSWGFLHFILSLPTVATMVLRPHFDPEDTLRAIAEHRARVLAVVPVMMQRILALPEEAKRRYDLSSPRGDRRQRLVAARRAGDGVDGRVRRQPLQPLRLDRGLLGLDRDAGGHARRARHGRQAAARHRDPHRGRGRRRRRARRDGPDLRRQPARLRGLHRRRRQGASRRAALLGDVGHFDEDGRLFIDGRDDEMIVSGGENVFPREIEDLLADHEGRRRPRRSASTTRTSASG